MVAVKVLVLALLMSFGAQAASLADPVVKLTSYFNGSSLQPRLGSGMVIQWQGHKYILTSDHVVYHSNRSFAHEAEDSQGHKQALEYLVSDAGRGLALLKFQGEPAEFATFTLDAAQGEPPVLQERVTMIGYPADSDAVLMDKKGRVKNLKFASEIFVQTPELIEIGGSHGEFGMSGGAAFSAGGVYLGLLSHQIVQGQSAVLLISAQNVRQWLSAVLNSAGDLAHPSPVDLFQDPAQQVSDFLSYRTGNLYLAFSNPYGKGTDLSMAVMSTKEPSTDRPYGGEQGSFAGIKFKKDFSVICMGFREKKVLGGYTSAPQNVNAWLRWAINPQVEPLWTYDGTGVVASVRRARSYHREFANLASRLRDLQAARLANYVYTIALRLEYQPSGDPPVDSENEQATGSWRLIKPKDLNFILEDSSLKDEWGLVRQHSLEHRLRQKLVELRDIMSGLTF